MPRCLVLGVYILAEILTIRINAQTAQQEYDEMLMDGDVGAAD